ncbi:hypothetical protein ID850_02280 [Xenorhabdus sp. Flor]|uniref:hypothetical protein n=1 Tax=Xenorhabdus cabanillasii TaxID=351673 RepID=UPI00198EF2A0|nr:hypothetical protein [Xenorhabdus sp. Flor]MBD2813615.1 hypothetical protein [Xenorhabdus sp. Flor]
MDTNNFSTDSMTGNFLHNTTLLNSNINDTSATNLTVANLTLADEATKNSLAQQLCDALNACILAVLTKSNIADLKLTDATLINPTINKSLKLDADALASLLKQLNRAKLESLTLLKSTLDSPTIQDSITLDPNALTALMQQLKVPLDDQIIPLIQRILMEEPVLNKPTISGGLLSEMALITSNEISNNTGKNNAFSMTQLIEATNIEGHLTLDVTALTDICTQLSPCIQNEVDNYLSTTSVLPKNIVGCDGNPLKSTDKIATCDVVDEKIKKAAVVNPQIVTNLTGCDGNPLKPTDKIATCDVVDEKIKKATVANPQIVTNLTGCDGNALKQTDKIATCEYVQAVVKETEIKSITGVTYDQVKKTMTFTVTYTNGDKTPLTVDMSHMQMGIRGDTGLISGGKAATTTSGTEIPTTFFGGRAMLLGTPDAWFTAGDYVIPAFKKA